MPIHYLEFNLIELLEGLLEALEISYPLLNPPRV
jgi:hypothetical protein